MKCNECGYTKSYKKYGTVYGTYVTHYNEDGTAHDRNDEMHDSIMYRPENAQKHCGNCDKKLTKKELSDLNE